MLTSTFTLIGLGFLIVATITHFANTRKGGGPFRHDLKIWLPSFVFFMLALLSWKC